MRTGRVVVFASESGLNIGQVTSINPQGGAEIKTSPDATPVFVEKFHKIRPLSLKSAVSEFGATLSNDGLSFPTGLKVSLDDLGGYIDISTTAANFIGVPLGEESVANPNAPQYTESAEEDDSDLEEEFDGEDLEEEED